MIHSNSRKLALSGWLKQNHFIEYDTPLKLQKFLLLYEAFSKVAGDYHDFAHLRGYKRGPVFSEVWGDYTKERKAFDAASDTSYENNDEQININRAKKCAFLVSTLTEKELSDLTHGMNIWKVKEDRIMRGEYQVDLHEKDFDANDAKMMALLDKMCPMELIDSSSIVRLDDNYFVFNKHDIPKLTEEHFDILATLSEKEELHNPVYVEVDEEGGLLVD